MQDTSLFNVIVYCLSCLSLYVIVAVLMYFANRRCHICGALPEKYWFTYTRQTNGNPVTETEQRTHELTQCPQCGKWTCYKHWHEGERCCIKCVPEWKLRIEKAERLEEERKSDERVKKRKEEERIQEEERKRRIEREQAQALKKQQEMEKEIEQERKCHICGTLGSNASKLCNKCGQWTCANDIYRGICKRCWQN